MKTLLSSILIATIFIMSCEKDKSEISTIIFNGITNTNEDGMLVSEDSTDWKLSENWKEKESSLFDTQMDDYCVIDDDNYSIISYPNPCDGIFTLNFTKPVESLLSIRIVDKEYNLLLAKDSIYSTIAVSLNDLNVHNDTVRVYYKFTGDNCELKGHGDIKIE